MNISEKSKLYVIFLIVFLFLGLFSCKEEAKLQKTSTGLSYRILKKSKIGTDIPPGSMVEFQVLYFTMTDSLLFNSDEISLHFRMKIDSIHRGEKASFNEAVLLLQTGDSAEFFLNGHDFYKNTLQEEIPSFLHADDSLRFVVKIKAVLSDAEVAAMNKRDAERREAREAELREEFLHREKISQKPNPSGLIVIRLKEGKGDPIKPGETAVVSFLGSFLSGKVFDFADKSKPAEFVLGSPEIIPAWNEAVSGMKTGEKIQIIAPSNLAYGKQGLETIIPPYATLIYIIELEQIKK